MSELRKFSKQYQFITRNNSIFFLKYRRGSNYPQRYFLFYYMPISDKLYTFFIQISHYKHQHSFDLTR